MASCTLPLPESSNASELEKKRSREDELPTTFSSPNGPLDGRKDEESTVAPDAAPPAPDVKEPEWAHGFQLFTIIVAVTFVCFLMLLDGTIVVAAVPRITDDFKSLKDIGWYGAAYQLGRYVTSSLR